MDTGREFGTCRPCGDGAEFRQVAAEGDLDGQAQRTRGRVAECDPFSSVGVACPFDDDIGVGAGGR